jgi:mRNA interferase HigB
MRVIAIGTLRAFWMRPGRSDAEQPLRTWLSVVRKATWSRPTDIKEMFRTADFVSAGRVIFNIGGNKYRLVAAVHYRGKRIYIRFIGTHAEYDKIDVRTI